MRGKYKVGDLVVVVYPNHPRTGKSGVITKVEANNTYDIYFEDGTTDRWDNQDCYFEYNKIQHSPLCEALK